MSGVNVLDSYVFNNDWLVTCMVVVGVLLIVTGITTAVMSHEDHDQFIVCVLSLGAISIVLAVAYSRCPESTRYKVTVDDSVKMTEFLDKYEIIDKEGKIYTVEEREVEKDD